jgi:hypothetical protein
MKRIRNIHDLEYEKLKLRVKQLELENQMSRSWKHIKDKLAFTPDTKQPGQTNSQIRTGNPILNGAFNYGASFLSHRLGMIAGKKIESTAELLLEKLALKLTSLASNRKRYQKANKS